MQTLITTPFLRNVLRADALVSGAVALLQLLLSGWMAATLALPHALLQGSGAFLVLYVLFLLVLASARTLWLPALGIVILGNLGWAAGCVALLMSDVLAPTGLGIAFIVVHAATVMAFAALEFAGMRQAQGVRTRAMA